MATRTRAKTRYSTYGSVAYAPAYDEQTSYAPKRKDETYERAQPKTHTRKRARALTRTQVRVREAGEIAPFAVVGFLAVAAVAMMLIFGYVQQIEVNHEIAQLSEQMASLRTEHVKLSAQYEKTFDLASIQAAIGGDMVRASNEQILYIDLSKPDEVVIFSEQDKQTGIMGAVRGAGAMVQELIEYFR